jgi:hypothetical protein
MCLRNRMDRGIRLFLEPTASYEVAQGVAGCERLALSEQTLRRRC